MRKINFKFLACLAMTLTALCAVMTSAQAQRINPIFGPDLGQSWQYYQEGNEPAPIGGLNWKTNTYNDTGAGWNTGYGVFAYEPDTPNLYPPINTTLNRTLSDGVTTNVTYYFRTHFNFPINPTNIILYCTNLVDDGCVVYLNGVEIYRFRVTGTPPTWGTRATGGPAAEGSNEVVILVNSPRLRQGDNVIAVELHDGGTATAPSSDVAYGLGLGYAIPEPIVITKQPLAKVAAVEGDDVILSVEVAGTSPRYWWFRNGVFLTGQTNFAVTNLNITLGLAGTYHCVISNALGGVRSSNSVVTVVPDTFGPRLLDAFVEVGETNRLMLQFDEDVNNSAGINLVSGANTNNYEVSILGFPAQRLMVTQAQPGSGNGLVRLTLGGTNFNRSTNYQICIRNVGDRRSPLAWAASQDYVVGDVRVDLGTNYTCIANHRSATANRPPNPAFWVQGGNPPNIIAWNSCFPIGYQAITNAFEYDSYFLFNEWGASLDNTNWTALNYFEDSTRWGEERGIFFASFSPPNNACVSVGKNMSLIDATYYFRIKFIMPTNLVGIRLDATFGHAIDDGAVFYLNETEFGRYNMPSGPVTFGTRPNGASVNSCRTIPLPDLVLKRTNIFAAELHQVGGINDLTAGFGADLQLTYIQYPRFTQPTNNMRIFVTNFSPTHVAIYHTNTNAYGWTIQTTTNIIDPWREVQPATNRLVTPKTDPRHYYRLLKHPGPGL
jgi:hypothetical protein